MTSRVTRGFVTVVDGHPGCERLLEMSREYSSASLAYLVVLGWTWLRRTSRGKAQPPARPAQPPDIKDG